MRLAWLILTCVLFCGFLQPGVADAQFAGKKPVELEGVEIIDRAGEMVAKDLRFVDETGKQVVLGDYFGRDQPVLVQFVYHRCPMLCTFVLNAYVDGAKGLNWRPGRDYQVLSVSFDPTDTPKMAAAKKKNYVAALGGDETASGWHFLTGEETQIKALADALGFRYRWVEEQKEFAHAAGMFALTPDGKISRTLYGIEYSSRDLKLTLVEAGEGRLGSPFDRLLLYCFQYDGETHKYALVAVNIMKLGGLATVLIMGTFLLVQWRRRKTTRHPGKVPVPVARGLRR